MQHHPRRGPRTRRRALVAALLVSALVAVLGVAAAGTSPASARSAGTARIVNGNKVAGVDYDGRWKFIVALVFHNSVSVPNGQFCAGSLIAPDRVLTAAHCVLDFKASDIDVVYGQSDLSAGGGQRIQAKDAIVHPQNDPLLLTYDAAVIHLTSPVTLPNTNFPNVIQPVGAGDTALWGNGMGFAGAMATGPFVAGWGMMTDSGALPTQLREAYVPIIADTDCVSGGPGVGVGYGTIFDPNSMLCAGVLDTSDTTIPEMPNGVDSCNGDSGGPLIVDAGGGDYKLAGIVSFGITSCAARTEYGAYTRVGGLGAWVQGDPVPRPINTKRPTVTGDPFVGVTLSCSQGTWSNSPTSYAYHWARVSDSTGDLEIIAGATSHTYAITSTDAGDLLYCIVTASNASGATSSASAATWVFGEDDEDFSIPVKTTLKSRSCKHGTCTIYVYVVSSSESRISAADGMAVGTRHCKHRPCARVIKTLHGTHVSGSLWRIVVKLPRGKYTAQVVGMDRYGVTSPTRNVALKVS